MKSCALMLGVACATACSTARTPVQSEGHPRVNPPAHVTVANFHRQTVRVFARTDAGVWRVGRVAEASTETFPLAPHLVGRSVWLVLRCRAHREDHTTHKFLTGPGIQIDVVAEGHLNYSRTTLH